MQGPDLVNIMISGLVKPLMLLLLIGLLYVVLHRRSAALKHFCLLMGILALLLLPLSDFLMPDITWSFPLSHFLFQYLPFSVQEYLLKTSSMPVDPFWWMSGLAVYLLVSSSIVFYWLIGFFQFWSIYKTSSMVRDAETLSLLHEIKCLLDINSHVKLVFSSQIDSPCVWGFIAPRILLPQTYQDWTYEQKISVLMHELGHVHRRDALSLLVMKITCAVFWFLPPVWWIARKMAIDSEVACDDLIYRLRDKHIQYAEHLLQLAQHQHKHAAAISMSGAVSERSEIYQRIMSVLDNKKPRHAIKTESVQYPIIIGLLLVVSLGALDNINIDSAQSARSESSVLNWSWGRMTAVNHQDQYFIEAEKTLASVDELQTQEKPILITRINPMRDNMREKMDYAIDEEYKTHIETDKHLLQQDLLRHASINQSLSKKENSEKENSDYRVLQSVTPEYPDAALQKGVAGIVSVLFDLDDAGAPINIRITHSQPDGVFNQAVIQSLEQSRFAWRDKKSIHSSIKQDFIFQLDTRRKR